ncbi:MAG: adenylosuccinate synthase [Planctomycetota bacterium]|jgi:adenylosuccinate synthase
MPVTCVFGAQWGDEGKGKIVDFLARDADYAVRFQGGANAGHTIRIGDETFAQRLTPSGVLAGAIGVIANGVALDPIVLKKELETLDSKGIDARSRLHVSDRAQLVLPFHGPLDRALDASRNDTWRNNTTGRGISTCMGDKHLYEGFRVADLLNDRVRAERLRYLLERGNARLRALGVEDFDIDGAEAEVDSWVAWMRPLATDTTRLLQDARAEDKNILIEGAQAALLDVDFGTYPFVTSSSTGLNGVASGTGLPPRAIDNAIAVAKAYITRVGSDAGPFPSAADEQTAAFLQERGREFGTVTGRPRRCGWFDAVAMGHVCRLNGVDSVALTKIDVLADIDPLRICVAYECDGQRLDSFPADIDILRRSRPVFRDVPGFKGSLAGVRTPEELPSNARQYVAAIQEEIGTSIGLLSVGPERTETITLRAS